jgi:predicted  nucleic acid-binding Zn-ribbon protein
MIDKELILEKLEQELASASRQLSMHKQRLDDATKEFEDAQADYVEAAKRVEKVKQTIAGVEAL